MTQNKEILAHLKEHKTIVTNKQNKKSFAQYEYIGHESEPRQEQLL